MALFGMPYRRAPTHAGLRGMLGAAPGVAALSPGHACWFDGGGSYHVKLRLLPAGVRNQFARRLFPCGRLSQRCRKAASGTRNAGKLRQEGCAAMNIEPLIDIRDIFLGGIYRNAAGPGDFLQALAQYQKHGHLLLARRETESGKLSSCVIDPFNRFDEDERATLCVSWRKPHLRVRQVRNRIEAQVRNRGRT